MTKALGSMVSLIIVIAMLLMPAQPAMAVPAGVVDLVLLPAAQTVNPGDALVVTVQAECGTQATNGIDVFIDFDPQYLEVQSITPGTILSLPLQNEYDNTLGTIGFSAGSIAPVTDTFDILTITFTAKSVLTTTSTVVSFHTSDARTTLAVLGGDIITGTLTEATYTINDVAPPTVQGISPGDIATDVPINSAVAVTFSEAMNQSATEGAFSIDPSVAGAFSWNPAGTILTFTPTANLAYTTVYGVGISIAATDMATNPLAAAFASSFTTQDTPPSPPVVATEAATGMTNDAVTLNGNLTDLGTAGTVNVSFEYGYTTAYGKTTAAQSMDSTGTFTADVTGLFPEMDWHYRAVAVGDGTVYGDDATVTTSDVVYDTAKFAFVSARDGNQEVYAITPDGAYSAQLTDNAFEEEWPRFLPDFTQVTFTSWRDGNAEVYVMNPDGTVQTRITDNAAFDGMSDFSWDGSKITFVSNRDGNYEIYVMNADGTGQTRLTSNAAADIMPAFSQDGTQIAFASNRDGNYEVYVMNADGSSPVNVTNNAAADNYPSWFNDNTQISFSSARNGTSEIYTMDANGGNQTLLITDGDQSAWCPTGGAIFYTQWSAGIPQIMFIGTGPNTGAGPFPFTSNPEGNWSRANWTAPATQTYTITASVSGGNGTVDPLTQPINAGANATITITPDTDYHVASITDNGIEVVIADPYVISNVSADHTVVVVFSNATTFTITASAGVNGSVTPSGVVTVNSGASQSFTIAANAGYHVADVLVDAVSVGAVESYDFTDVTANHTISATFAADTTPTYTITASAGVNGSVTPSGVVTVNSGASQSFTIAADAGYHVADVLVDGVTVGAVGSYDFTDVTANHTISATFADDATEPYTITASAGANGSVMPLGIVAVNPGASQSFTIAANAGYHVADVLVDAVSVGAVESYDFTDVMANHTIMASFAINDSPEEILKSIIAGTDDGYSTSGSGDFNSDVEWYEAGSPIAESNNNAWFRFTGITIPANAIIDEAYLETIQSRWDTGTSLKIFAEAADNPSAPTSFEDHSSRVRTTTGIDWTSGYTDAMWHASPNFASVIQELVSDYSYNSGVIQILVDNNGSADGVGAAGFTFENSGFAPRLYIHYHVEIEPSVTTNAATSITTAAAGLNGNLTSLGSASSASVSFEYGTSTSYGNTVAGTPSSLAAAGNFTANLTGLTPGTTYFYRAKAVGTGTVYGAQVSFTTLSAPAPAPAAPAPAPAAPAPTATAAPTPTPVPVVTGVNLSGISGLAPVLNTQGEVILSSVLTSLDGQAQILVPAGTTMLDGDGAALNALTCTNNIAALPEPPAGNIVVVGYDFGPDGATFNPPITLTLNFNIEDLPAGTVLSELQLAFWDGTTWQILSNSRVDEATGQISAKVSHFTNFAILSVVPSEASAPAVTPTDTPVTEPASAQPTETPASIESSPVVSSGEEPVSETQQQSTTEKLPAASSTLWIVYVVVGIVIISGILAVVITRRRRG